MRKIVRLAAFVLLAGCGLGNQKPPPNVENACAISRDRPEYRRAFERAERRWDVPVPVQMAVVYHESGFDGDARTRRRYFLGFIPRGRVSSAYGYPQAIDGTWDEYRRETGRRFARRDDIDDAADFIGWYMNNSRRINGIALSDARRQYLAYHEGNAGYARGSYTGKPWLQRVARDVAGRAERYDRQLARCS